MITVPRNELLLCALKLINLRAQLWIKSLLTNAADDGQNLQARMLRMPLQRTRSNRLWSKVNEQSQL